MALLTSNLRTLAWREIAQEIEATTQHLTNLYVSTKELANVSLSTFSIRVTKLCFRFSWLIR